jgi:hypothetical protein
MSIEQNTKTPPVVIPVDNFDDRVPDELDYEIDHQMDDVYTEWDLL